jgi:hypothetical protein
MKKYGSDENVKGDASKSVCIKVECVDIWCPIAKGR